MCRNHVAPWTMFQRTISDTSDLYIDVQRPTKTSFDVLPEAAIDDCCDMDGDESLSELGSV